MKTLIFEGIVTSGKSTVAEQILKSLAGEMSIELATEEQTHVPIMGAKDELHVSFFNELINRLALKRPDLLIFDRLYITQAYRAHSGLVEYSSVEDSLLPHSPHTIVLKMDDDKIADRIKASANHRGQEWLDFWKTKGETFEEIAQDYIEQQKGLLALVKQSKIPYSIFDTTNYNFDEITGQIIGFIRN